MPLCKPLQAGPFQVGWTTIEWPFARRSVEEVTELGNKGQSILAQLRATVVVQQAGGGVYALLKPVGIPTMPSNTIEFRLVLRASAMCIATAQHKSALVTDCQDMDYLFEMLAGLIESGQRLVGTAANALEQELFAVLQRVYTMHGSASGTHWERQVETALGTLRTDEEELEDFEDLGISGDSEEGEGIGADSASVLSASVSEQSIAPLSDEVKKQLQAKLRSKRRAIEEKKKRYKWKHVSNTFDGAELNDLNPAFALELQEPSRVRQKQPDKEKEREQEPGRSPVQTRASPKIQPAKPKGDEWVGTASGSTPTSAGTDQWLWMEVTEAKKETLDEFYAVKDDSDVSMDNFISRGVELSSDTTWMSRNIKDLVDTRRYNATKSKTYSGSDIKNKITWNGVHIPLTRPEAASSLHALIRNGIPDSKRGIVWQAVAGCQEFKRAYPSYYEDVIDRVFGDRLPTRFFEVPQFGGELNHSLHYLNEAGQASAHRVLWALAMENPEVDYAPSLPDVVCILQSFQSEADCYITANLMLEQSRDDRWFFPVSNRHITLFLLTFQNLIRKYLPRLAEHMDMLSVDPAQDFANAWFKRLFVTILPYQTMLRVFDMYMNEGNTVLYKIALGLLRVGTNSLLATRERSQFINTLQQLTIQYEDADHLIKQAVTLVRSTLNTDAFDEANKKLLTTVAEPLYKPYYRPKIECTSSIIDDLQFEALWSLLPSRFAIMDPLLVFSTAANGFSLKTLLERAHDVKPAIMLIRDRKNHIFGAFSPDGIRHSNRYEQYYGTTETMVFTLTPQVRKFTWLAGHARQFVRITKRSISFGDGKALVLDEELWHGTSGRSQTFENAPLCGDDDDDETVEFDCTVLEIYGLQNA